MNNIASELNHVKTVAIAGHVRPDGDCVGSSMGMYLYVKKNFPHITDVDVYLEAIPNSYRFLQGTDEIHHTCDKNMEYDLFISLDCGDKGRLGDAAAYFETAKRRMCIDHHISNSGFADVDYIVPEASSTSELVYDVLDKDKITKEIAEALYMGIAHDTGVFQYSCTSPKTMRAAADLMDKGIDFSGILDDTYFKKSYVQNQILGRALLESIMVLSGQCIISAIRQKDMVFYGVEPKDLDGIVSQLRNTKGVEVAIFIYETGIQEFKVSMRSNGIVDVSKVGAYFGGGGHVRAAGCTMQGTMHDVLNNLTKHIEKQLLQEKES
ncbi:bifunctional oligoribonuclease/PAP phosphatase NrnA [uncultured Robinsoniella sp.]|uniref:DHH family phosphoesterase n=1 Tax=uncultured Robinsoniella sp. TaxID=904190 RepID=UPI00374F598B